MITGRSVHNQRIERLWRDLFTECTYFFYSIFYTFEEHGVLDPNNEKDLHVFALHFVFLPEIKRQLANFKNSWNNHKMRTCHNRTPLQLWMLGIDEYRTDHPNDAAITGLIEDWNQYGIDWDGPVSYEEDAVIVPEFSSNLDVLTQLLATATDRVDDLTQKYLICKIILSEM